jgi:hypothetical protein
MNTNKNNSIGLVLNSNDVIKGIERKLAAKKIVVEKPVAKKIVNMKARKQAAARAWANSFSIDDNGIEWQTNSKGIEKACLGQFMRMGRNQGQYFTGIQVGEPEYMSAYQMMHPDGEIGELSEIIDRLIAETERKEKRISDIKSWIHDLDNEMDLANEEMDELLLRSHLGKSDKRRLSKLEWLLGVNMPERAACLEQDLEEAIDELNCINEEDYILEEDNLHLSTYSKEHWLQIMDNGRRQVTRLEGKVERLLASDRSDAQKTEVLGKMGEWLDRQYNAKEYTIPGKASNKGIKVSKGGRKFTREHYLAMKVVIQEGYVQHIGTSKSKELLQMWQEQLSTELAKKEKKAEKPNPDVIEGNLIAKLVEAQECLDSTDKKDVSAWEMAFEAVELAKENMTKFFTGESDPGRKEYSFNESLSGAMCVRHDDAVQAIDTQWERKWWHDVKRRVRTEEKNNTEKQRIALCRKTLIDSGRIERICIMI